MDLEAQSIVLEAFERAKEKLRKPQTPKQIEKARQQLTEIKRSTQAYLEHLEQGTWCAYQKMRNIKNGYIFI
jgi:hypothetical protein